MFDALKTKPTIYVLIGPPASGKSTWRAAHMAASTRPTFIFSSDDEIFKIAGEQGSSYDEVMKTVPFKEIEKRLKDSFRLAVQRGDDIIIDRTNMSAKARNKFLANVGKNYQRVGVLFRIDRETLNRRMAARKEATGMSVPPEVVDEMLARYEEPTTTEFHRIEVIDQA